MDAGAIKDHVAKCVLLQGMFRAGVMERQPNPQFNQSTSPLGQGRSGLDDRQKSPSHKLALGQNRSRVTKETRRTGRNGPLRTILKAENHFDPCTPGRVVVRNLLSCFEATANVQRSGGVSSLVYP